MLIRCCNKQKDIDVLCILTPSGLHAEHTIDLTQYKKHMVVEKPMALTIDDADDMIHACDRAGSPALCCEAKSL